MIERSGKLQINHVSRIFKTQTDALVPAIEDVSMEIHQGEFVCLVGPSGCGKSTFLMMIAGLQKPDKGEILLNGAPIQGPGRDRIVIFQEPALFPWLTVQQNVEFGLKLKGMSRWEREEIAIQQLKKVHLLKFRDTYISRLSGGMKQRVALARSLSMDPEILLMDEPFAALDAQTRDLLNGELQTIWQETHKTILFVTHNVREAVCLGDRVIVFTAHPGKIKREFRVEFNRPRQAEDIALMQLTRPILEELKIEVEKYVQGELDREYKIAQARILDRDRFGMGAGI